MRRQRLKEELARRRVVSPAEGEAILARLQNAAASSMADEDWGRLRYHPRLTAAVMTEFKRRLAATGNSLVCSQAAVDLLATHLQEYKSYREFAAASPQQILDGCGSAFEYLFSTK